MSASRYSNTGMNAPNPECIHKKLNTSINHRISLIREYPSAGLATDKPGIRFHIIDRHYKLFYKVEKETAYILRFWDTRQDPDRLKVQS